MKLALAIVAMLLFIALATIILFSRHAKAEQLSNSPCFDELLFRWNELAKDSNQHIQTVEVNPEKHRKMHDKLDKEYAAVKALACW